MMHHDVIFNDNSAMSHDKGNAIIDTLMCNWKGSISKVFA